MDENDMTVSDLGQLLGSKGNASEILSGKRSLSKAHMATLARRFAVNVSLFFPRSET
jgi:HTH-type transcriptional regulator/antitoxin HigA